MIEIGVVTTNIIIELAWLSRTPEPVEKGGTILGNHWACATSNN